MPCQGRKQSGEPLEARLDALGLQFGCELDDAKIVIVRVDVGGNQGRGIHRDCMPRRDVATALLAGKFFVEPGQGYEWSDV